MSQIGLPGAVPVAVGDAGRLPAVCPRHGYPASGLVTRTFHRQAPVWLLPAVWLFSPLVAAFFDERTRVTQQVPVCAACRRGQQRARGVAILLWVALVLDVLAGTSQLANAAVWLLLPLLVAAPVATFVGPSWALPSGYVSRDGAYLVFKPAAPAFRAAINRAS